MHDFLLAKEIIDQLKKIVEERKVERVKKAKIEIGQISLAHDGHLEHIENISVENLQFSLKSIARNTLLEGAKFEINKVAGDDWKIVEIEV
jgi:Zn finger protein HypA/HybF involved in hydrogenase expression